MHPVANSLTMARYRVVLSAVSTVLFFVIVIAGIVSHLQFHGKLNNKKSDNTLLDTNA